LNPSPISETVKIFSWISLLTVLGFKISKLIVASLLALISGSEYLLASTNSIMILGLVLKGIG
jgi:hypothetical protein